jgi:hypothetical protein
MIFERLVLIAASVDLTTYMKPPRNEGTQHSHQAKGGEVGKGALHRFSPSSFSSSCAFLASVYHAARLDVAAVRADFVVEVEVG